MAQLYNIKAYSNTGFNSVDRPSKISVLELAQTANFPSNYLRQNNTLTTTRIEATWDQVKNIDYVSIGDSYYLVNSVSMLSDHTAEISLTLDPVLTAGGVDNIEIIDGWAQRAHVQDDTLFANNLPEPWQPSSPLKMDGPLQLGPSGKYNENTDVSGVLCTVDLENIGGTASTYKDAITNNEVTVPEIPSPRVIYNTNYGLYGNSGEYLHYRYPLGTFFNVRNESMQEAIKSVRSLGIDTSFVKAYKIPQDFINYVRVRKYGDVSENITAPFSSENLEAINDSNAFTSIVGIRRRYDPDIKYKYSTGLNIKNNKAYSLYNMYNVVSVVSGDTQSYPVFDIANISTDPTNPPFIVYADCGPDGKPYCQPMYYEGAETKPFMNSVAGGQWLAQPLGMQYSSGWAVQEAMVKRNLFNQNAGLNSLIEEITPSHAGEVALFGGGLMGMLGGILGLNPGQAFTGGISGGLSAYGTYTERQNQKLDSSLRKNLVAPEVKFPVDPALQGYIGNGFVIFRTRLSDNDLVRFDNFLTQYGYSVDERFVHSMLDSRTKFNYIKTTGAAVKTSGTPGVPSRINEEINRLFDAGVRLWHILPISTAMLDNPIKE